MAEPDGDPDLGPQEHAIGERLSAGRPVPRPTFRGALGRYLVMEDPGHRHRPANLWLLVTAFLAAGLLLLVVGLVQTGLL